VTVVTDKKNYYFLCEKRLSEFGFMIYEFTKISVNLIRLEDLMPTTKIELVVL
jgi:hypothetical protein